jgi:hypothetical protein
MKNEEERCEGFLNKMRRKEVKGGIRDAMKHEKARRGSKEKNGNEL